MAEIEHNKDEVSPGLIEIHDPEIDVQAIMEEIKSRIRQRRQQIGFESRNFPSFGAADYPGEPDDLVYDPTLYHYLRLANEGYSRFDTTAHLSPSPATRVPLLGSLWGLIRDQAHQLVLFYVNRNAVQQMGTNRNLISVLNRLTALHQDQQRELVTLRAEITDLRAVISNSRASDGSSTDSDATAQA